jgi:hypothetical protein
LDLASKIQTRAPGMTPYKGTRPTPTTKTTNPSYTDAPPHPALAGVAIPAERTSEWTVDTSQTYL